MTCILKVQTNHDIDVDGTEEQLQEAAYWLLDKMENHLHRANEYFEISMNYDERAEKCEPDERIMRARYEEKARMFDKMREENLRQYRACEDAAYILGLTVVQVEVMEDDK